MYRLAAAFLLLVVATVSASAQNIPVPSYWKNQQDSELVLTSIDAKGNLAGSFISQEPGFACSGTFYDLKGRAHRKLVRFTVVWKNWSHDCNAETEWYGRVNGKSIVTFRVFKQTDAHGHVTKKRGVDTFHEQP